MFFSIGKLKAQDSIPFKKNEVWVNFFNPGVAYKRGLNTRTFLKAGITFDFTKSKSERDYVNFDPNFYDVYHTKIGRTNQNNNVYLGIEKRSNLSPMIMLFHGPDLSYGFSSSNVYNNSNASLYERTNHNSQTIGAGYTIGASYSFISSLGIGIYWSPRIFFNFYRRESTYQYHADPQTNRTEKSKENNFGVQLSTPGVSLILKF